ncbi:hypothetical protein GZL_00481 [Streptomyces sp. 769]|nr:hypothetical protein GZL_00481 [Streptomyces sp. 769]
MGGECIQLCAKRNRKIGQCFRAGDVGGEAAGGKSATPTRPRHVHSSPHGNPPTDVPFVRTLPAGFHILFAKRFMM